MMRKLFGGIAALATTACAFAGTNVYTNEGDFVSDIQGDYYLEQFNGYSFGVPYGGDLVASFGPVNGYSWDATGGANGLFSIPGALSTNNAGDPLTITLTGAPVTAIGGLFSSTDFDGNPTSSNVSITLSNGHVENIATGSGFRGFTSAVPILSVTIDDSIDFWPAIDNFYVGNVVPEPTSLALFAIAGLGLLRRR